MSVFGEKNPQRKYRVRPAVYLIWPDTRGRVATVRTRLGLFLPGGGIETGESPEVALVREIIEELGGDLEIGRELGTAIQHFSIGDDHITLDARFFSGRVTVRTDLDPEYEVHWVNPSLVAGEFYYAAHAWAAGSMSG